MKINWDRIFANAFVAFFTVFAALSFAQVHTSELFLASFYGAFIQAGMAAAKDYKDQSEGKEVKGQMGFLVV